MLVPRRSSSTLSISFTRLFATTHHFEDGNHEDESAVNVNSEGNNNGATHGEDAEKGSPSPSPSPSLTKHQQKMLLKKQQQEAKAAQRKQPSVSKNAMKKALQLQATVEAQLAIFDRYYVEQYGEERWASLVTSLKTPVKYVALLNQFANRDAALKLLEIDPRDLSAAPPVLSPTETATRELHGKTVPYMQEFIRDVFIHRRYVSANASVSTAADETHADERERHALYSSLTTFDEDDVPSDQLWAPPGARDSLDENGLCMYYPLDAASLLPVLLLDLQPHHRVADLCSAPGGKALAILQQFAKFFPNYSVFQKEEAETVKESLSSLRIRPNIVEKMTSKADRDADEEDEEEVNLSSTCLASFVHSLACNDVSPDRRIRLKNVIRRYLPRALYEQVDVFNVDVSRKGSLFGCFAPESYDRVLLDAPCSSERHLISDFLAMQNHPQGLQMMTSASSSTNNLLTWAPGRNKANAERQFSLLCNAVELLNMNGKIVYSTCALNKAENDDVVEKYLRKLEKKSHEVDFEIEVEEISSDKMPFGEKTRHGWHILPDNSDGWGPIYLSVLKKVPKK